MAIQQKLQTRLSQKLILTPSLQQAIKLLPMTTLELAEMLTQEMVENPLLEEIPVDDPPHVHQPLIQTIVDELNGEGACASTGVSGARTTGVVDEVLREYRNAV